MTILLYADPAGPRRWLRAAKERLDASGHDVRLVGAGPDSASGRLLRVCERIDRALHGGGGAGLAARLDGVEAAELSPPGGGASHDGAAIEIRRPDTPARRLAVLYDGETGDEALFAALLDRRSPLIALVDTETSRVVASGSASLEAARSLLSAADAVYARLLTLIEVAVAHRDIGAPAPQQTGSARSEITVAQALRQAKSGVAGRAIRAAYETLCHFPHWRVGWRPTSGGSIWETKRLDGAPWQVLPDPGDHFYADPFPIVWGGRRMIFFEDLDHRTGKGAISAIDVGDDGKTGPVRVVLEEPWHLSYPFMIEDGGALWMIPESSANRTVDLYRAASFPDRWVKEATLLSGIEASDATVIRHGNTYWMTASVRDGHGSASDTLCLFSAPALAGPWAPHPANPVLIDARSARPAGNMVVRDGALWRPAQVCDRAYGAAVALCEVTRLDATGYRQEVRHVLTPGAAWPGSRLHTLNEAFGLSCIDGWAASPRHPLLARLLEPWCLRRATS